MHIAVLANRDLRSEFESGNASGHVDITWVSDASHLANIMADAYMDFLFTTDKKRIEDLASLLPKPVFINEVVYTLKEVGYPFIRINGWPGFLDRKITEIAVVDSGHQLHADAVMTQLQRQYITVPDEPGMIVPRILSMIINEAYFALEEGVSTRDEIDVAMRLGTNYPFGPFEWCKLIGIEKIFALLSKLCEGDERYKVAEALRDEHLRRLTGLCA